MDLVKRLQYYVECGVSDDVTVDKSLLSEAIAALQPGGERGKAIAMLEGAIAGWEGKSGGFALSLTWAKDILTLLRTPVAVTVEKRRPVHSRCAANTPFRDAGDNACIACGHDYDADKTCPNAALQAGRK